MTGVDRAEPGPVATADPVAIPLRVAQARRRRFVLILTGLGAGVFVVAVAAMVIGSVAVAPLTVLRILGLHVAGLGEPTWTTAQDSIIWLIRFPRVILGLIVGAGLAVVGVAIQAMVRNPIADTYVLGVSSGASLGAVIVVFFAGGLGQLVAPSVGAFLGALGALFTVFVLARGGGRLSSIRLLLIGVSLGYSLSGMTSLFLYAAPNAAAKNEILFWILGSLGAAKLDRLLVPLLALLVTMAYLQLEARRLNALSVGDEASIALGVEPHRLRVRLLVVTSLFIGAATAAAGPIGFVGLVVPHVARILVGADHPRVLPVAALLGAGYLVAVDLFGRTILAPAEIPIGVITAVLGGPLFIWLVRRDSSKALKEAM